MCNIRSPVILLHILLLMYINNVKQFNLTFKGKNVCIIYKLLVQGIISAKGISVSWRDCDNHKRRAIRWRKIYSDAVYNTFTMTKRWAARDVHGPWLDIYSVLMFEWIFVANTSLMDSRSVMQVIVVRDEEKKQKEKPEPAWSRSYIPLFNVFR